MSTLEGGMSVAASIESLVAAFQDADILVQRLKGRRLSASPDELERTVLQAAAEIEKEENRGKTRLGTAFDAGDYVAVIGLQQVTIQLQTGLLQRLREATITNTEVHFDPLIDLADSARDAAISTLISLRQRLTQAGDNTVKQPSTEPLVARQDFSAPPIPEKSSSRRLPPEHIVQYDTASQYTSPESLRSALPTSTRRSASLLSGLSFLSKRSARDTAGVQVNNVQAVDFQPRQASITLSDRSVSQFDGGISPLTPHDAPSLFAFREIDEDRLKMSSPGRSSHSSYGSGEQSATSSRPRSNSALSTPTSTATTVSSQQSTSAKPATVVATPSPQNDFLGFCKGAWRAQNDDPKAIADRRDFTQTAQSRTMYPSCGKCAFRGHTDSRTIWNKVTVDEARGLKYRWAFLAKSHVKQRNIKDRAYTYQCLFCVLMGQKEPIIYSQNAYLDHISKEHRGQMLDEVMLYRTRCVNNRVSGNSEAFDINLLPMQRKHLHREEIGAVEKDAGFRELPVLGEHPAFRVSISELAA